MNSGGMSHLWDCSAAAAAFPSWGPLVTEGSNRLLLRLRTAGGQRGTHFAKELHGYLMKAEEVWELGAVPGDYFFSRKGSASSLVPLCFVPGLFLPFILALDGPELKPLEILFSQPTTLCLMALLCQSRPFLLHSFANLQAACVGTDFLTTPNHSLLISVK